MQEVRGVEVDQGLPGVDGDDRAQGKERAERDRGLAALLGALARRSRARRENAGEQRDQDRGRDGAAEEQAHHAGELDVAHAHAAGVGQRGEQQKAAGGGPRDQALGLAGGVERGAEDEREDRAEQRSDGWG